MFGSLDWAEAIANWMAWRSGARERFGYRGQARSLLLTNRFDQALAAIALIRENIEAAAIALDSRNMDNFTG